MVTTKSQQKNQRDNTYYRFRKREKEKLEHYPKAIGKELDWLKLFIMNLKF